MSWDYVLFDATAAQTIVSASNLQSIEFAAGEELANVLVGRTTQVSVRLKLDIRPVGTGLYVFGSSGRGLPPYLVVDGATCGVFSQTPERALVSIQKVLRFAIKHWSGQRHGHNVKRPPGTTLAVVFPYPIFTRRQYRLLVELNPSVARIKKRYGSKNLLVYADSEEGQRTSDNPKDTRNFKRAFAGLEQARAASSSPQVRAGDAADIPLTVTELAPLSGEYITPYVGFAKWMELLTKPQREFVDRALTSAERLEGPAGTGKTLCLVLKCINALRRAESAGVDHHAVFFAHSAATEGTIRGLFEANLDGDHYYDRELSDQSVTISTLQAWCGGHVGVANITATQYLDQDAMAAKELRQLMVQDIIVQATSTEYPSHRPLLSDQFTTLWEAEGSEVLADMVQHEIAVMIKGRAKEDLETYQKLPFVTYGIGCRSRDDRAFVYMLYERYTDALAEAGEFDTDDIVLTALGHLQTPIWRRRRRHDAYDAIYVDETHLFNLNELSVFHLLTRGTDRIPIAYSIDRSQAPGDRGLTHALVQEAMCDRDSDPSAGTKISTVFRCAPEVVALATCVTASGASLFTNFDDPLSGAHSVFTAGLEQKSATPALLRYSTDAALCVAAYARADHLAAELECGKSGVLVIACSNALLANLKSLAVEQNKAVEVIERRGDLERVTAAQSHSRYVLALPDYVGGLEFDAVVMVGADQGRVPPSEAASGQQSRHYLAFRAHNRVYVSVTRARYRVEVLINNTRGLSDVFAHAVSQGLLEEQR